MAKLIKIPHLRYYGDIYINVDNISYIKENPSDNTYTVVMIDNCVVLTDKEGFDKIAKVTNLEKEENKNGENS